MDFGSFVCLPAADIRPPHWTHGQYLALKNMEELQPFRGLSAAWIKPHVRVKMGRRDVPQFVDIVEGLEPWWRA